jgi:hypothetical protein
MQGSPFSQTGGSAEIFYVPPLTGSSGEENQLN